MYNYLLIILLLFLSLQTQAQKANYPLAEKFSEENIRKTLKDNSMAVYPKFIHNSDKFWFDFTTEEGKQYYFVNPDKRELRLLFNPTDLAAGISKITHKAYHEKNLPLSNLEFSRDLSVITFTIEGKKFTYHTKSRKIEEASTRKLNGEEQQTEYSWMNFSPDKKYMIYAKGHNLYVRGNKYRGTDTTEIRLTWDGERFYSFARNEEDTTHSEAETSVRWFGNSRKAYLLRTDNRKVEEMAVVNALSKRPTVETYRYEIPGDKNVYQQELWIVDIEKKKAFPVKANKWPDQAIEVFHASPKGDKIYFERQKRTWEEAEFCVADTETGEVKVLIQETDKPFRDYHMRCAAVLNDGKDIIFRSERTGWGHYYHYDGEGHFKNVITSGSWVAGQIAAIDTLGRTLYFYGHGREKNSDPYYYMVYKAHIDREGVTLLSRENSQHKAIFSPSRKYFIDNFSRVDQAPHSLLKDNNGKIQLQLPQADVRRLYEMGWKAPERFTVKAADGITDLYGIMWKPADFDSTRQYPIISSVYPGPFYEYVITSFTPNDSYNTRLAQLGFIVVAMGHRGGSPMRGKFYHTYGHGNLRDYPLADDKYAIMQLANRYSFIDGDKVGIFGHSGGGFMATAAICTYPGFYTAAVASSGNHDNNIFNREWSELYHGVKETKTTGKDSISKQTEEYTYTCKVPTNLELAKNLQGHLLLVTGDMDKNVHPAHTLRMADALIKAGKNFDLLVLPGQGHGYFGNAGLFFERKLWAHFARYLLHDLSAGTETDFIQPK